VKLAALERCPSGFLTATVHAPASPALLNSYRISLADTNVSFAGVLEMLLPVGGSKISVAPLTKFEPEIVIVWFALFAAYMDGETLLIVGADAVGVTVKVSSAE